MAKRTTSINSKTAPNNRVIGYGASHLRQYSHIAHTTKISANRKEIKNATNKIKSHLDLMVL